MPNIPTSAQLPQYSSAPSSPAVGDIYFDTTDKEPKVYVNIDGTPEWFGLGREVTIEVLTPSSQSYPYTWVRPTGVRYIDFLMVRGAGGGGAGGSLNSPRATTSSTGGTGGGGAGGMIYANSIYIGDTASFSITVGTGGNGGAARTHSKAAAATTSSQQIGNAGSAGGSTSFGSITASGGGGGAVGGSIATAGTGGAAGTITGNFIANVTTLAGVVGGAGGGVGGGGGTGIGSNAQLANMLYYAETSVNSTAGATNSGSGGSTASGAVGVVASPANAVLGVKIFLPATVTVTMSKSKPPCKCLDR